MKKLSFIKSLFVKYRYAIILILLLCFYAINNFIWLQKDTLPLDEGGVYLITSINYFNILNNPDSTFFDYIHMSNSPILPFIPLSIIPLYYFFGVSNDIAVMVQIFYLALLFLSVYGIGKKLHSRNAGLLAVFIISTSPIMAWSLKLMPIIPSMAMVSLTIYSLLLTDYFKSRKYSLFCAISLALTLLTRWELSIFIALPFLIIFLKANLLTTSFKKFKLSLTIKKPSVQVNFILFLLLTLLIYSIWVLPNFDKLIDSTTRPNIENGKNMSYSNLFSPESLLFYLIMPINNLISFPYFLIFLIAIITCLIYLFLKKIKIRTLVNKFTYEIVLISWIVFPYIFFTFTYIKAFRFIAPFVPPFALLTSLFLFKIHCKNIRRILVIFIILLGCFQFHSFYYGPEGPYPIKLTNTFDFLSSMIKKVYPGCYNWDCTLSDSCINKYIALFPYQYPTHRPVTKDIGLDEILLFIYEDNKNTNNIPIPLVGILPEEGKINLDMFKVVQILQGIPLRMYTKSRDDFDNGLMYYYNKQFLNSDYLIIKTSERFRGYESNPDIQIVAAAIENSSELFHKSFKQIKQFGISVGSTDIEFKVYRRHMI